MLGTITKGEYKNDPLPDNVYLARLISVKEKAPPKNHPDWYPSLSWTFEILQDPFKKRRAWGKTPCNWIQGKKLDNWLVTIGINAAKGQSVKIEDIKDVYTKILVKSTHYKDTTTQEDKVFQSVTELLPLDSLDQIKIRELVAGASAPVQHNMPSMPPVATAPVVVSASQTVIPTQPAFAPAPNITPGPQVTGIPSRTIPF